MRVPRPDQAGGSKRLASAFSAGCGTLALGLTVAACYGLAHVAQTVLGGPVPGLLVRVAAALLGVPAALLVEAGAFRLVGPRRRQPSPESPAFPANKLPVRPTRLKAMSPNHLARL